MRVMLIGVAIEGGGAERVIVDLARGLRARGHEVMVVFLEGTDAIVPSLTAEGIRCERLLQRQHFAAGPLADFTPACILRFRQLIRQWRPDLIDAHIPRPTMWAALAQRSLKDKVPFIYTEHNIQSAYPSWSRWIYGVFLPVTDHVIAISQAGADSFVERWQWERSHLTRIWNGIQPERVVPRRSALAVREELGVSAEAKVVLNVGNLTSRKAQEVLVRSLSRVQLRVPEVKCWIAGSLELEPGTAGMIQEEIKLLGLEQCLTLLGPRRDVADLIAAADVFVLSSRQEGFPITILEAMAAGKPVVTTAVGGCAEAVVHGVTGLVVPAEDPRRLADALVEVLNDSAAAARMGAAGRRRVESRFSVDTMVEEHLTTYTALLAESGLDDRLSRSRLAS